MSLVPHCLPEPEGLVAVDRVFDIGAGIRPINWGKPKQHICVEPHGPYAAVLRTAGYQVVEAEALDFVRSVVLNGAGVYLLDVIEHMERAQGETLLEILNHSVASQIVVYTPNGFRPQEGDVWGLGGEHWQKHRSGWVPEDFPGWDIQLRGDDFYAIRRST